MSDKPTTAPAADESRDSSLMPRRILTWVVSAVLAFVFVALGIKFFLKTELNATVPISFVEVPLLPLAALPMTLFFMIWLDILFGSKIVND